MLDLIRNCAPLRRLLLLLLLLHLGPQGAVICTRGGVQHSYGAACSCRLCKDEPREDDCCRGESGPCLNSEHHGAVLAADGGSAQLTGRGHEACCSDHRFNYQNAPDNTKLKAPGFVLQAALVPGPAACAVPTAPLPLQTKARGKAPPGAATAAASFVLPLRI